VALLFAVWIGLTALSVLWVEALGLDAEEGQTLTDRLGTDATLEVLILVVILTVLGPLSEEFLFRGYIFRALRNWRGVWPAALAASVLFAATHIGWLPIALLVPTALFGIAMCLLYHWTGSLYPCIAGHAINTRFPSALRWMDLADPGAYRRLDARCTDDRPPNRCPARRTTPRLRDRSRPRRMGRTSWLTASGQRRPRPRVLHLAQSDSDSSLCLRPEATAGRRRPDRSSGRMGTWQLPPSRASAGRRPRTRHRHVEANFIWQRSVSGSPCGAVRSVVGLPADR